MTHPSQSQQDNFIEQQYSNIIKQREQQIKRNELSYKNVSVWSDAQYKPTKNIQTNQHNFNLYADKQLIHLVVEQKFDFLKISQILGNYLILQILAYSFKNDIVTTKFTQQTCRERWYQLHRDRQLISDIKQKNMQNKRITSILCMTDPFSLYDIDERLHKMQKQQKSEELEQFSQQTYVKYQGYNIFKDSIRKIDNIQQYNFLQKQMRAALGRASQKVQLQKPMLYSPYYDRLQEFQVQQEQLTYQKMQQMMSHPIEMQLMERQLKVRDVNEKGYQSKVKKQTQKKFKQQKIKNQEQFQIEEDWDAYESD